jgi:hypothetical protein
VLCRHVQTYASRSCVQRVLPTVCKAVRVLQELRSRKFFFLLVAFSFFLLASCRVAAHTATCIISFCALTSYWYVVISCLRIERVRCRAQSRNVQGMKVVIECWVFICCWTLVEDLSFWMWQEIVWLIAPSCSYGKGRINPLCSHENNLCTSKARVLHWKAAFVLCSIMLLIFIILYCWFRRKSVHWGR